MQFPKCKGQAGIRLTVLLIAGNILSCNEPMAPDAHMSSASPVANELAKTTSKLTTVDNTSTAPGVTSKGGVIGAVRLLNQGNCSGNVICSGVLVERDRFLTAGNCLTEGSDTMWAANSLCVWFPQRPDRSFTLNNYWLAPGAITRSYCGNGLCSTGWGEMGDLALLALADAVPADVVEQIPPILLTSLGAAVFNPNGFLAGGQVIGGGIMPDGSSRAWFDVQSFGLTNSGRNTYLRLDPKYDPAVTYEHGTGAPIFIKSKTGGHYFVVAVWSGGRAIDNGTWWNILAPTGKLWTPYLEVDNGSWLTDHLSDDADQDGFIDYANDNCPPSRCTKYDRPASDCANTDQVDADHDGIGDACDNCPPSVAPCSRRATRRRRRCSRATTRISPTLTATGSATPATLAPGSPRTS